MFFNFRRMSLLEILESLMILKVTQEEVLKNNIKEFFRRLQEYILILRIVYLFYISLYIRRSWSTHCKKSAFTRV